MVITNEYTVLPPREANNIRGLILSFLFIPHIVTRQKAAWREVLKIYRNQMVILECLYVSQNSSAETFSAYFGE